MEDKVSLGRKGEIFVMGNLLNKGWSFPDNANYELRGSDWAFTKNGRTITLQIKTSEKRKMFTCTGNGKFDYLVFTNLKDIWIIPPGFHIEGNRLTWTMNKLKNKFELLELDGLKLLSAINDCGIKMGDLESTEYYFKKENDLKGGNKI